MIALGSIKRRYADLRFGFPLLSPVVVITNFLLLAYNFTFLKDVVSFPIFAFVFTLLFLFALTALGMYFRKIQLVTDFDIQFESKQNELRIYKLILKTLAKNETNLDDKLVLLLEIENLDELDKQQS